ncbi:hypothetical protein BS17DRAFT_715508 [Gyrodon lividus]|nr:hypothetical protein BS17DRAFT_715508 [Gyrodon lividus]
MLECALKYQAGINVITEKNKLGLSSYGLSEHEWELLEQLHDVLKILKDATLFFSHATPNLAMVVPAMDFIDEMFTTGLLKKQELIPVIRAAIGLAKKTLNRYYSLTDLSELYHIAMVLHPQHKMEYFKEAGWSAEWTVTALQLVCNTYNNSYASRHIMPLKDRDVKVDGGNMEAKVSTNDYNAIYTLSGLARNHQTTCLTTSHHLPSPNQSH